MSICDDSGQIMKSRLEVLSNNVWKHYVTQFTAQTYMINWSFGESQSTR